MRNITTCIVYGKQLTEIHKKKNKKLKNTYRKIWKIGRQLKAGKEGIVAFLMKINTYKYVRKHGGP
jgi:hypothetical protein